MRAPADAGKPGLSPGAQQREALRSEERAELRTLGLALLASLLLWNLPFGGYAMYPFKLLATWMHELSHGIMMLVTGAGFDHMIVYRDTSGMAFPRGSVGPIPSGFIAAAGYMGTPVWGAVLLVLTPDARTARRALLVLAALLVATAIIVIAPEPGEDAFGPWAIGAIGAAIAIAAIALPARWRVLVAHFLAGQACVNALLDIRVLLRPTQVVNGIPSGFSDAHAMALMTFDTEASWAVWFWATTWLLWSLAVFFVALRVSGRRAAKRGASGARATA